MNSKIVLTAGVIAVIVIAAAFVALTNKDENDPETEIVVSVTADSTGVFSMTESCISEALEKNENNPDAKLLKIDVGGHNDKITINIPADVLTNLSGTKLPVLIDTEIGGVELPNSILAGLTTDFTVSFENEKMDAYPNVFKETFEGYRIMSVSATAASDLKELADKVVYRLPYTMDGYSKDNVYSSSAYFLEDDRSVTGIDSKFIGQKVCVETDRVAKIIYKATLKENAVQSITVKMSNDEEYTLSKPATKIAVVSSNESEMCQILGLEKYIVGLCDGAWEDQLNEEMRSIPKIGKYSSVTAEKIALTGAQYIISPYPSMGLPAATVSELKSTYGITTLYFDCYGTHLLEDVVNLAKIFGDESALAKAEEYVSYYNNIEAVIASKVTSDKSIMFVANGMGDASKYYTDSSELVKKIEKISGSNALQDMGANQGKKSTVSINGELVYNYDASDKLDILFIRSKSGEELGYAYDLFYNSLKSFYGSEIPKVVSKGGCYELHTDVVSGCRDFIGDILIAQAYGFDTGLDASMLFDEFNMKYGFGSDIEKVDGKTLLLKHITA
ncbi:MAG: hypothetical protein MJZ21_04310 [archaeon]|nr:hypothetical protein [archaeon]